MLKIALSVGIGLLVLIAAILIFAATRPDQFRIQRSLTMKAPPRIIFAQVNGLRNWANWSPWEKLDPQMQKTFTGPESGPGAKYAWSGNDKVGAGEMEIKKSNPDRDVDIDLHFIKPWEGRNRSYFLLTPEGESTNVTWSMEGQSPFMFKLMGIFVNMDEMIGKDFARGLEDLRAVSEAAAAADAAPVSEPSSSGV